MDTNNDSNTSVVAPTAQPEKHIAAEGETIQVNVNGENREAAKELEESPEEIIEMGSVAAWLKAVKSPVIKYGSTIPKKWEFRGGNYAEIYRGDTFIRYAPFVAKEDLESGQNWAEFSVYDFYDKKRSPLEYIVLWPLAKTKILWMPLNKSPLYCDNVGGGGLKIKVDEYTKSQVPLYVRLPPTELAKELKNNRMIGFALLLKAQLQKYEKPRTNWGFWLVVGVAAFIAVGIGGLYIINPHLFSGIGTWFHNLFSGLSGFNNSLKPPGSS